MMINVAYIQDIIEKLPPDFTKSERIGAVMDVLKSNFLLDDEEERRWRGYVTNAV